jgi:hypothetical protein
MTAYGLVARAENFALAASERVLRPGRRACPCCGWSGLHFRTLSTGGYLRRDVICPECGSFERHRALSQFYPAYFGEAQLKVRRLIHCAPERCLAPTLSALCDVYETSAYGEAYAADHRLDLTEIDLPDASCDALVLNHVLDCMEKDAPAVAEMFRVLTPDGVALAAVSFDADRETRWVPPQPNGLRRIYGGHDLARVFAPFDVDVRDAAASVPSPRRMGVPSAVPILVLRKPSKGGAAA